MGRMAVLLTLGAMILAFVGGVAIAQTSPIVCPSTGGECEGTNKEDTILGSPDVDTIIAKRGGDTVDSDQGGDDTVLGGKGNDEIDVSDGVGGDFVNCGGGRDDSILKDSADTDEGCEETLMA